MIIDGRTVQTALRTLSEDAKVQARSFTTTSGRLWGVVYDNINFTLRTTSQRLVTRGWAFSSCVETS
jgi:hypothetical protein